MASCSGSRMSQSRPKWSNPSSTSTCSSSDSATIQKKLRDSSSRRRCSIQMLVIAKIALSFLQRSQHTELSVADWATGVTPQLVL